MHRSNKPLYMVVCCTLFASAAITLLKRGMTHSFPVVDFTSLSSVMGLVVALITNVPLITGFALHACNALLLILALRDGELSILWPVYALSYVWAALLAVYFFSDRMNLWKGAGIGLIIVGVGLLGRANQREGLQQ